MATGAPYSPFARRRGNEQPQFDHVPIPRKAPPPAGDLGLPNASFLQDLTGSFRNSVTDPPAPHSESGDDDDDPADHWDGQRQQITRGPSNSAGFYNLAQRVTSSVSSFASGTHGDAAHRQLTDSELEAEAAKEREHSRREAERILMQEAEERRRSEDAYGGHRVQSHLPPLRPRRSTIDVPPAGPAFRENRSNSPGQSNKGWWSMAKQKLTPTKNQDRDEGPLTPAQAIMREAKKREADPPRPEEPEEAVEAPRPRKQSWFSSPKGADAAAGNGVSPGSMPLPVTPPHRERGLSVSPAAPGSRLASPITPPRVPESSQTTHLNLSPSQRPIARPQFDRAPASTAASSFQPIPPKDPNAPTIYAQFNPSTGALDVAATLLTVATRFEKLERWTVNHVRALEERMKDVERFLVDKEGKEDEVKKQVTNLRSTIQDVEAAIADTRATLPAQILSNLLLPPDGSSPRVRAESPGSQAGNTSSISQSYHSASGSPSLVPYGGFERAPRQESMSPDRNRNRSYTNDSTFSPKDDTELGPTGTVKQANNFRNRLPYPSGDYYDTPSDNEGREHAKDNRHPSMDPYTPPTKSSLSLVSASGSPILPIPRAVSPLALSPIDLPNASTGELSSRANSTSPAPVVPPPLAASAHPSTSATPERTARALPVPTNASGEFARAASPLDRSYGGNSPQHLPAPGQSSVSPAQSGLSPAGSRGGSRGNSISPTPRKRYTVALSGRTDTPQAETSSNGNGGGSGGGRMKVHTALFTSSPSFESTSSLASSLRTPVTDSETETGDERDDYTSPNTSATTDLGPSPPTKSGEKPLAAPFELVEKGKKRAMAEPLPEETEEDESTDAVETEDDKDGDNLFTIGTTPIALRRISSPPPSQSPTPSARARLRSYTTQSGNAGGYRSASPVSPSKPATNGSTGFPRAFGGLGTDAKGSSSLSSMNQGSVSSMGSSSTTSTTDTSSVTSGSYRTPYSQSNSNSPPALSIASTTRPRAQTALTPRTSPPLSAGYTSSSGYYSTSTGSPGSDRGDKSDADVFAVRSVSRGDRSFVDPYIVRKREKERHSLEVKAVSKAIARKATDLRPPGKKPPVGDLVAFFQATKD